jgi:hypothetical protein
MPARKAQRVNAERSLEGSMQRRRKVGRFCGLLVLVRSSADPREGSATATERRAKGERASAPVGYAGIAAGAAIATIRFR